MTAIAPPLLSRALRRAIAYCKTEFEAEMNSELPSAKPTPAALKWRAEATEYNALLKKIEPKRKGAAK